LEYIGLQTQISRNNFRSILLLIAFPAVILGSIWLVIFILMKLDSYNTDPMGLANSIFIELAPFVVAGIAVWFVIAFLFQKYMIKMATKAHTLDRKDNMRVYNLVENLCMSKGMKMPKVHVIKSDALNAFASGITESSYTVTLTQGIIDKLEDDELEGVIAHELMHIRNKDVRLLIISIIFVGIISFIIHLAFRSVLYGGRGNSKKSDGKLILIVLAVSLLAYLFTVLFKLALSRKREYMADAGAAEMTKNPTALANALRKISGNSKIEGMASKDVEQMYIDNTPSSNFLGGLGGLFATHPPIEKRIETLEQF
jgi:heat shock protein HtpX